MQDFSHQWTLWWLPYSPWSQKARWALEHAKIKVRLKEYIPIVTPFILGRSRQEHEKHISVPLLKTSNDTYLQDSALIAHQAHAMSKNLGLDAPGLLDWNVLSEKALQAGRGLSIKKFLENKEAQEESLYGFVPPGSERFFKKISTWQAKKFLSKYGKGSKNDLRDALVKLREGLQNKTFIYDEFSYADIAMALCLDFVSPPKDIYVKRGPAMREVWSNEELALEFSNLVEWRDDLYERYHWIHQ